MAVSKRLRYEVLNRDSHTCRYCGQSAPEVKLTIDHVVPIALGGEDKPSNLVAACADCNAGKTSSNPNSPLIDDVSERAVQWSAAMEAVAAERRAERVSKAKTSRSFKRYWDSFKGDGFRARYHQPLPHGWQVSIEQIMAAGLDIDDLKELAGVAMSHTSASDKWRYFCGCCWNRVKQNTDRAVQILTPEQTPEQVANEIDWENYDDWLVRDYEMTSQYMFSDYRQVVSGCLCSEAGDPYCGKRDCVAFYGGYKLGQWAAWAMPENRPTPAESGVSDAVV